MKRFKKRFFELFLLTLAFSILGSGCAKNPFRTRNSPEPISGGGTWTPPSKPEIVLENLLHSYNEKIIENFNLCLSDTFLFSAPEDSIEAVNNHREWLFASWNLSVEKRVTSNVFKTFSEKKDSLDFVLYMDFGSMKKGEMTDTTAALSLDYKLSIYQFKPTEQVETAEGVATFYLRETGLSWWSIYFWSDVPSVSGGYDWGDFKAEYRD